jgi:4'-phosphopantetheinyl transferase
MPLYKTIKINESSQLFLWKIEESFEDLFDEIALTDLNYIRLNTMKSESHQKGFLSVRMLLKHCGYSDFDLIYDQNGKPHLKDGNHISISHSNNFSAIAISDQIIGIDIEQCKEKVLRIASRFMDVTHLENLSHQGQIQKSTVVWGIKESIFKIKNEKGISFPDHIFESDFQLSAKKCTAELHFNNFIEDFTIHFDLFEDYAYVCAFNTSSIA